LAQVVLVDTALGLFVNLASALGDYLATAL